MGPASATWTGLRDWNEMMRHGLEPWELKAIARLAYTRAVIEGEKMSQKAKDAAAQNKTK